MKKILLILSLMTMFSLGGITTFAAESPDYHSNGEVGFFGTYVPKDDNHSSNNQNGSNENNQHTQQPGTGNHGSGSSMTYPNTGEHSSNLISIIGVSLLGLLLMLLLLFKRKKDEDEGEK